MSELAAVIQMCSGPDRENNLSVAGQWMAKAVQQGARLLVLPENFSFMGHTEAEKRRVKELPETGLALLFLRELAAKYGVWIVGGSIPIALAESEKITNTCFVVDDCGEIRGRYDKIHLFDVSLGGDRDYRESDLVHPGNQAVVVATPFGRLGLTICYDLRFPELFRELARRGSTIITVPSAFTATTGHAHWELLLRARAVENFCYVLASGQGGQHPGGRRTYGHSMIVEPWGTVVARCPDGDGVVFAELDEGRIRDCRNQIPCLDYLDSLPKYG